MAHHQSQGTHSYHSMDGDYFSTTASYSGVDAAHSPARGSGFHGMNPQGLGGMESDVHVVDVDVDVDGDGDGDGDVRGNRNVDVDVDVDVDLDLGAETDEGHGRNAHSNSSGIRGRGIDPRHTNPMRHDSPGSLSSHHSNIGSGSASMHEIHGMDLKQEPVLAMAHLRGLLPPRSDQASSSNTCDSRFAQPRALPPSSNNYMAHVQLLHTLAAQNPQFAAAVAALAASGSLQMPSQNQHQHQHQHQQQHQHQHHPHMMTQQSSHSQIHQAHTPLAMQMHSGPLQSRPDLDFVFDTQPPVEVRTRTPREVRNFSVIGTVVGRSAIPDTQLLVKAELYYAPADSAEQPQLVPGGDRILGGSTIVNVQSNGMVVFNNLSVSEASAKHNERDFCIGLTVLGGEPMLPLMRKFTNSFYTYSHKKVLERRRSVKLRTLSATSGPAEGGVMMHVIGSPFIAGPYFTAVFTTSHGSVRANGMDLYSDCVSFFQLPPCPGGPFPPGTEIQALVSVTNDGRNFSEPLEFTYIAGASDAGSKKRSFVHSRM